MKRSGLKRMEEWADPIVSLGAFALGEIGIMAMAVAAGGVYLMVHGLVLAMAMLSVIVLFIVIGGNFYLRSRAVSRARIVDEDTE